ncbi:MAG TPA: patatin-like phospholipase family protein [Chitinophagaceae bacterium]|jgi:predicted acylesterase/phospholipase RssA|nr:patatin-like phospholipase family protein [Chitinophagaceae bacterium]
MKRALVISGGGSKGAFAVGILQRLRNLFPTLKFDIIVGTSTGALIAPLAASGELDLLEELYTIHKTENVVTKHRLGDRLNQKSIYTVEPLWQLVKKYITDHRYDDILQSGSHIYVVTTCLQTQEVVVFTSDPSPQSSEAYAIRTAKDGEHMRLAVLASACQPVFMTPVKVDSPYATGPEKDFQYVDGGVREYAGIQMAIDQGANEVFCVLLAPEHAEKEFKAYETLFPILERTISMFSEDVEKNDILIPQIHTRTLKYLQSVKQNMRDKGVPQAQIDEYFKVDGSDNPLERGGVKLFIIRPEEPLGGGPGGLVFNPAEMKNMVNTGKGAAQDFVAKLNQDDVTWLA